MSREVKCGRNSTVGWLLSQMSRLTGEPVQALASLQEDQECLDYLFTSPQRQVTGVTSGTVLKPIFHPSGAAAEKTTLQKKGSATSLHKLPEY